MHDRIAAPFMITVHAPHWPSPQPKLRTLQAEIVAQDVEQRRRRIDIQRVRRCRSLSMLCCSFFILRGSGHERTMPTVSCGIGKRLHSEPKER